MLSALLQDLSLIWLKEAWVKVLNRYSILIAGAAVLITGSFFLFNQNKSHKVETGSLVEDAVRHDLPEAVTSVSETASDLKPKQTEVKKTSQDSHVERLKKAGYVDNPNDPYSMIKTTKTADGKERTYVMPKEPGPNDSFEPLDRTVKTAEETLNSKINENPTEEVLSLRSFDETDQNSMMLLGKFRDNVTDIELQISKVYDEQDRPTNNDVVCFVAPKLGLNFKKNMNASLKVDGTGYGVLQLSGDLFIRMAWSFEKKRILHGIVMKNYEGQARTLQFFSATENSQGMKYCD